MVSLAPRFFWRSKINCSMEIKEMICTCGACPTQYEIKLTDGRMVYVRYRWGYLSIRISENQTDNIYDAVEGKEIFADQLGGEYDGVLPGSVTDYLLKAGFTLPRLNAAQSPERKSE